MFNVEYNKTIDFQRYFSNAFRITKSPHIVSTELNLGVFTGFIAIEDIINLKKGAFWLIARVIHGAIGL